MSRKSFLRVLLGGFCLLLLATSCHQLKQTVEVPVYVHDTTFVAKEIHDSTYIDKWHTIYINGDTVRLHDSVVVFRYKLKTDTSYIYVEKPVTTTVTETVEVKKPLYWWQKTFIAIGVLSLVLVVGFIVFKCVIYGKR